MHCDGRRGIGNQHGVEVVDVCLIEVGGTVRDIELSVFLEALRQFQHIRVPLYRRPPLTSTSPERYVTIARFTSAEGGVARAVPSSARLGAREDDDDWKDLMVFVSRHSEVDTTKE